MDMSYERTVVHLASTAVSFSGKLEGELRTLAMSPHPVDVEWKFRRALIPHVHPPSIHPPTGPHVPLERLLLQEEPRIPKKIYALTDEHVPFREVLPELTPLGNYYITQLLSAGLLGKDRRVVPTRWAITATDSMMSRYYIRRIRDFPELSSIEVYRSEHFSNRFMVILIPGRFAFENFEAWGRPPTITREYEDERGRWRYASKQLGAYYAVRLAVAEYLYNRRRQASAVVIREIDAGYRIPLGVWQVRENVRRALGTIPTKASDIAEVEPIIDQWSRYGVSPYIRRSTLLKDDLLSFL